MHTEPSPLSMTNGSIHKFMPQKTLTKCVSVPSLGVKGKGRTGLLTDFRLLCISGLGMGAMGANWGPTAVYKGSHGGKRCPAGRRWAAVSLCLCEALFQAPMTYQIWRGSRDMGATNGTF